MVSSAKAGVKTARQSSATGRRALRRDVVHLYSARDNVKRGPSFSSSPLPPPPASRRQVGPRLDGMFRPTRSPRGRVPG